MYTISIRLPANYNQGLAKALAQITGAPLDLPTQEPAMVVFKTEAVSVIDSLKVWLDKVDTKGCEIGIYAGSYVIDMGPFCRLCQAESDKSKLAPLRPCPPPDPSAREWCPLAFALRQAAEDAEAKTEGRQRPKTAGVKGK
ncbi:MAG: hypothetical protein HY683_02000 [Chloroflexi bacterium]|nr:hypothetical protein [Chloroflexota bacterium]